MKLSFIIINSTNLILIHQIHVYYLQQNCINDYDSLIGKLICFSKKKSLRDLYITKESFTFNQNVKTTYIQNETNKVPNSSSLIIKIHPYYVFCYFVNTLP